MSTYVQKVHELLGTREVQFLTHINTNENITHNTHQWENSTTHQRHNQKHQARVTTEALGQKHTSADYRELTRYKHKWTSRLEAHNCELGTLTRGTGVTIGSGPDSRGKVFRFKFRFRFRFGLFKHLLVGTTRIDRLRVENVAQASSSFFHLLFRRGKSISRPPSKS